MPPSILIPAHNEAAVIGRTLASLLDGLREDVDVLVACNGCSDGTAEVARRDSRVRVLEIDEASKTAALNAGDEQLAGFPRLYLDADIALAGRHAMLLIDELEGGAVAAEPRPTMDTSGAGLLVRAYYAVWARLHGKQAGDIGAGVYAMSAEGRQRFETFPKIISDDGFVRAHFGPGEIRVVEEASSRIETPRSVGALIRIKSRSRLGAIELAQRFPELWKEKRQRHGSLKGKLLGLSPLFWPLVPVYAAIQFLARKRAERLAENLEAYRWERDDRR